MPIEPSPCAAAHRSGTHGVHGRIENGTWDFGVGIDKDE
jgi:hypothetical protein